MTRRRQVLKVAKWTAAGLLAVSLVAWALGIADFRRKTVSGVLPPTGLGVMVDVNGAAIALNPIASNQPWLKPDVAVGRPFKLSAQIPYWLVSLLGFLAAAALFLIDRRRILHGHCRCGYDLTGNTSGRCPECGEAVARPSGAGP